MVDHAYWASAAVTAKMFEVAKLLAYISFGVYFAEFFGTMRFDMSILSGKRQRRWPQLAYFGTKYLYIGYLVCNLIALWSIHEIKCQALIDIIEFGMGLVVCLSSFLLACRTICVFQGATRTVISTILLIFGLGLAAAWMHGVPDVTSSWHPEAATPWNTGGCVYDSVKSTYWVKYIITIVFDLLVLVLTTFGILRMEGSSRIGDVLIHHGLIYFILTFLANMAITILTVLNLSPVLSLMLAVPQSTVCVICSTRLYIQLSEAARSPQNVTSTQLTSSNSSKISDFLRKSSPFRSHTQDGIIPFSANKMDMSFHQTASNHSSNSSSHDDLEKKAGMSRSNLAPTSPTAPRSQVRVEQTREVHVDSMQGAHPFSSASNAGSMPSVNGEDESRQPAVDREVALQYPRLLGIERKPARG